MLTTVFILFGDRSLRSTFLVVLDFIKTTALPYFPCHLPYHGLVYFLLLLHAIISPDLFQNTFNFDIYKHCSVLIYNFLLVFHI